MCGRFALYSPYPKLSESLRLPLEAGEVAPRYNVPPGSFITAVRRADDEAPLVMDELWWGYKPHWGGTRRRSRSMPPSRRWLHRTISRAHSHITVA
ncbi:SOS response associated peptidase (SRAP) [Halomonas korlensis]|uniref:SOS response associated peptidase (SRAP) n=1 Tax=Halomonas korlensis TaxID=463301 RepID=A0A1I7FJI5_9GAMM|nr:SOS response-associated peptidase family protein [Halomonas korlensis]SFU36324.1 SOS response associated peptidase (SRAP) [Halomonas korlensis]